MDRRSVEMLHLAALPVVANGYFPFLFRFHHANHIIDIEIGAQNEHMPLSVTRPCGAPECFFRLEIFCSALFIFFR